MPQQPEQVRVGCGHRGGSEVRLEHLSQLDGHLVKLRRLVRVQEKVYDQVRIVV